jgi:hypothetical protein
LQPDLFEGTTPGPHFIDERCFGEDFAAWLSEHLKRRGLTPSPPIQEDWGWAVLSVGIMDESIGKIPSEWGWHRVREAPQWASFMVSRSAVGRTRSDG